ncbi:MAG: DNA-processing protein DprA [Pseudomonadota bacterium]
MADCQAREEQDLFYHLALCLAPGVGPRLFAQLVRKFGGPQGVFGAPPGELARVPHLNSKTAQALRAFDWRPRVERELEQVSKRGLKLVTLGSPDYPPRLRETAAPPPVLWVAGEIRPGDQAAAALVGCRAATDFGRETAFRLGRELAEAGVVVVSGGAAGIDTAAHQGALAGGGRTFVVLGCGVDVAYPPANRSLFKKIAPAGALISEHPLGTQPRPGFFPIRNRIIAGLSLAVVVVEAAEKSGALITARLALDENREVMAVPGPAGSVKSRGTNELLKQGARLVESGADILEEISSQLGFIPRPRLEPQARPVPEGPEETLVWEALAEDPVHVDVLARGVDRTPQRLAPILLDLELKGLVARLPGHRYARR